MVRNASTPIRSMRGNFTMQTPRDLTEAMTLLDRICEDQGKSPVKARMMVRQIQDGHMNGLEAATIVIRLLQGAAAVPDPSEHPMCVGKGEHTRAIKALEDQVRDVREERSQAINQRDDARRRVSDLEDRIDRMRAEPATTPAPPAVATSAALEAPVDRRRLLESLGRIVDAALAGSAEAIREAIAGALDEPPATLPATPAASPVRSATKDPEKAKDPEPERRTLASTPTRRRRRSAPVDYHVAMEGTKVCTRCGEDKPMTAYHKAPQNKKTGRAAHCADCHARLYGKKKADRAREARQQEGDAA